MNVRIFYDFIALFKCYKRQSLLKLNAKTFHDAQEQVIVHSRMTSKELHVVDKNIYKIVSMNAFFTQQAINSPHIDSTTNS